MNQHTKHRVLRTVAALVCGVVAAVNVRDLAEYEVPLPLLLVCGLAIFATLHHVAAELVDQLTTDRFTCEDCDFAVALNSADTDEIARWRQVADNHPHHRADSH